MCQFQYGLRGTSLQRHQLWSHSLDQSRTNLHVYQRYREFYIDQAHLKSIYHKYIYTSPPSPHFTLNTYTLTFIEISSIVVMVHLLAAKAWRVTCSVADLLRLKVQLLVVTSSSAIRMNLDRLKENVATQTVSRGTRLANYTSVTSVSFVTITTSGTTGAGITSKSLQKGIQ